MQPIDVYMMYCAMKAHFSKGNYDYIKYGGKSRVTKDSFWKRNDRHFFVRTQRKYKSKNEIENYLLSNFIKNRKGWLGDFNDDNYIEWQKKMQSLTYTFEQEVTPLLENFQQEGKYLFAVPEGSHPKLLREYLGKRVSIETMIILDSIMDYTSKWDIQMQDDVVWPDIKKLLENYKKFLTFNKNKCKMILINLTKKED